MKNPASGPAQPGLCYSTHFSYTLNASAVLAEIYTDRKYKVSIVSLLISHNLHLVLAQYSYVMVPSW